MPGRRLSTKQVLMKGWHGAPQLKQHERRQFLGEFAERVLVAITMDQVKAAGLHQEVTRAVKDPRAKSVIAHMAIPFEHRLKYQQLAQEAGLSFTARNDPSYIGDVGLVVVSDTAVTDEV